MLSATSSNYKYVCIYTYIHMAVIYGKRTDTKHLMGKRR